MSNKNIELGPDLALSSDVDLLDEETLMTLRELASLHRRRALAIASIREIEVEIEDCKKILARNAMVGAA